MNGEAYVNKAVQVWNGTYFTEVAQLPDGTIGMKHADFFDEYANGMQFPPLKDAGDDLKVYDSKTVRKMKFDHDDDSQVEGSDVTLSKYTAKEFAGDVSFAFNQDFEEHAYGCGDCTVNTDETRTVKVDGSEYVYQSTESDNFMQVQRESGYTYQIKKKSTMFVVLGGTASTTTNAISPFPSLDAYSGMMFPWYDLEENMTADNTKFLEKLDFIGQSQTKVRRITISMSVFAAFFLILGIVSFILYKLKGDEEDEGSVTYSREDKIKNHDATPNYAYDTPNQQEN